MLNEYMQIRFGSLVMSFSLFIRGGLFLAAGPMQADTLYQAVYQYDVRGMVTNIVEQYGEAVGETRELEYDVFGRMTHEKFGEHEVSYQYDKLGNRIRQTGPVEQVYHYNRRNELLQQDVSGDTCTLSYDLNGSLIRKEGGAVATGYEWDSRGRLKRVTLNGQEVFRADYVGGLNRLRKTEGAQSTVYRHDGLTTIQEVDESGAVKQLVRGDRGASTVGGILYTADEEGTNTYTYNGVGSTVVLSGGQGEVKTARYDSFGNLVNMDEGIEGERLANTKELDQSTGLYYHGARYYDAKIGRYISQDPVRAGANHYVYANNSPMAFVDPTGLWPEKISMRGLWDAAVQHIAALGVSAGVGAAIDPVPCGAGGGLGICPGPQGANSMKISIQGYKSAHSMPEATNSRTKSTPRNPMKPFRPQESGKAMATQVRIIRDAAGVHENTEYLAQTLSMMSPPIRAEALESIKSIMYKKDGFFALLGTHPQITETVDGKSRLTGYKMGPEVFQPHGVISFITGSRALTSTLGATSYIPEEFLDRAITEVVIYPVERTRLFISRFTGQQERPMPATHHPYLVGIEQSILNGLGEIRSSGQGRGQTLKFSEKLTLAVHDRFNTGIIFPASHQYKVSKGGVSYPVYLVHPAQYYQAVVVKDQPCPPGTPNHLRPRGFVGFDTSYLSGK